jgi:hypothetical protein
LIDLELDAQVAARAERGSEVCDEAVGFAEERVVATNPK